MPCCTAFSKRNLVTAERNLFGTRARTRGQWVAIVKAKVTYLVTKRDLLAPS